MYSKDWYRMGVQALLLLMFVGLVTSGRHDIYAGYQVYSINLKNQHDLEVLHELESTLDLDVWQHGAPGVKDAHVMVAPDNIVTFVQELGRNGVEYSVKLNNVPGAFEEFDQRLVAYRSKMTRNAAVPYDDYPSYDQVDEYIERIAAQYPDLVTLVTVGQSYEGRDIKYLKISTTNFTDTSKPIYFMDAMIHAREWVTTPVTLYAIHRLVEDLRSEDRDLLEDTDWIIMPLVNPDGYEYSRNNERLWRRTRSYNATASESCWGVDANRNFDILFNTLGVSANPCSNTYPGTHAFSEPETEYVRDMLFEYLDRIQVYVNIHSYGNWILFGFGDTSNPTNTNVMQLHHVGAVMGAAIDAVKLPEAAFYTVGNSALLLYPTSGSAQDYAQSIGIPFSYTLELPEFGGYDFRVPPEYIPQVNEETWRGIGSQARIAALHYKLRIGL